MIDLERVATFIAVVKCGSFRAAARQTGLSQPTVTQHIKRLEQSLQARLIDRTALPQGLTVEGKIFFPYAEQLLRTSQKATAALRNQDLVVGSSSNIGIYLLQPYIKALQARVENKIDVKIGKNIEIAAMLESLEVDVAVMEWWAPRPGFVATVWRREKMVVIVPPNHPWAAESSIPLGWLKSQKLLGGEAATGTGRLLQHYLGADAAEMTGSLQLGSTEAVKHAVHAGLGISLVMESSVKREQESGWLHAIPTRENVHKDLYLVHRPEMASSGPAAYLADLILGAPASDSPKLDSCI